MYVLLFVVLADSIQWNPIILNMKTLTKISQLKPYANNAKKHPPEQVKKIADSILKLGCDQPIVVDKDFTIIAGHGRFLAYKELGFTEVRENVSEAKKGEKFIPVTVRTDLTAQEIITRRINDNKLAISDIDLPLIEAEFKGLDIEMQGLTGYTTEDFSFNFEPEGDEEIPRLDKRTLITCPNCEHEFDPKS